MIEEIKKFISYIGYYFKHFKELDKKSKEKSIMVILYLLFFTILLRFPIVLIRESILYFMTIYDMPNIKLVSLISRIVVEVIYLFIVLLYLPKNFNEKVAKKYLVNKV